MLTRPGKVTKGQKVPEKVVKRERNIMIAEVCCRNGISIRHACSKLDANRTTVSRRLNGGKSHRQASQDNQYLTPKQEAAICKYIKESFPGNCPVFGRNVYRKIAQTIIDYEYNSGLQKEHKHVSESWEHRIRQRNPILNTYKRNKKLLNASTFTAEFFNLKENLQKYQIDNENFYSVSEISIYGNDGKLSDIGVGIAPREGYTDVYMDKAKTALVIPPEVHAQCFVCVNANMEKIPALVAFKSKNSSHKRFGLEIVDNCGDMSSDNHHSFLEWLKYFERKTSRKSGDKYRAIYFEAHSYNMSFEVIRFAAKHKIIFLATPPERCQVQPSFYVCRYIEQYLYAHTVDSDCSLLDKISQAHESLSFKRINGFWHQCGLLDNDPCAFLRQVSIKSGTASLYRRSYATENNYYFGKKATPGFENCSICNKTNENSNHDSDISSHESEVDLKEIIIKESRKVASATKERLKSESKKNIELLDAIEFAQECQGSLYELVKKFKLPISEEMDLLVSGTGEVVDYWNEIKNTQYVDEEDEQITDMLPLNSHYLMEIISSASSTSTPPYSDEQTIFAPSSSYAGHLDQFSSDDEFSTNNGSHYQVFQTR